MISLSLSLVASQEFGTPKQCLVVLFIVWAELRTIRMSFPVDFNRIKCLRTVQTEFGFSDYWLCLRARFLPSKSPNWEIAISRKLHLFNYLNELFNPIWIIIIAHRAESYGQNTIQTAPRHSEFGINSNSWFSLPNRIALDFLNGLRISKASLFHSSITSKVSHLRGMIWKSFC